MSELLKTTCILCPNGCELSLSMKDGKYEVSGNFCPKGIKYAIDEYEHPVRTVTSTVKTSSKKYPRLAVKTSAPISKAKIFDVMELINSITITKPTLCGEVIVENILDTDVSIVASGEIKDI